jgi:hypothetical protein
MNESMPVMPVTPAKTNGLATTSLVLGITSFIFSLFTGVPAIICGSIALSQIKQNNESGRGMAITGIVLGAVTFVLPVIVIVVLMMLGPAIGNVFSQINNSLSGV